MSETVLFALIVCSGLAWWFISNRERPVHFRRRPILTGNNLEFFIRLKRALPECSVFPQVAATALLEPMGMGTTRKQALGRIAGRRVGFAVFDEHLQLAVVIELDHRPRLTRREAECESYFSKAGIRTLRFHTRRLPSEEKIRLGVFPRVPGDAVLAQADGSRKGAHEGFIDFKPASVAWRNTLNANS